MLMNVKWLSQDMTEKVSIALEQSLLKHEPERGQLFKPILLPNVADIHFIH